MLVTSRFALDCQQYSTSSVIATWENCSLRKLLNENFFNIALCAGEQEMIQILLRVIRRPVNILHR